LKIHKKPELARVLLKFFAALTDDVQWLKSRPSDTGDFNSVVDKFGGKVRGSWGYSGFSGRGAY